LQAFFSGQLVLGLVFGFVMLIVYMVLNVQYALLLSIFLAFCEILPVVGPPIGFAPAIIAVAVHGTILPGNAFAQILMLTLIFTVLQQVKDNVIAPRYMGNVIGLHPVLIFIAIMIGARLDGLFGIVIALPAASVINVLATHLSREGEQTAANDTDADLVVDVAEIDDAEESA
jgi:predicted PurR-regulated permease PerM